MDYKRVKILLDKYLEGNTIVQEEADLRTFFNSADILPDELVYAKYMFPQFMKEQSIKALKPISKSNPIKMLRYIIVAASIILLFGLLLLIKPSINKDTITEKNWGNDNLKIELPDGNMVWLSSLAEITYPSKASKKTQNIRVKGKVYIEILNTKSCNYTIEAMNALIQVEQMAAINIVAQSDKDDVNITVRLGTILVRESSQQNGFALLVAENHYCSVHRSKKLVFASLNKNDNYLAWQTGKLVFENLPMASVADVLADFYGVKLVFDNAMLAYCEFSGDFQSKSINDVLKEISKELNLHIQSDKHTITLSGFECM